MEAALRQKIGEAPDGSEEKSHFQEFFSLLSGKKTPESSSGGTKVPSSSFASIIEEVRRPMIHSSQRWDFGAMKDRQNS